MPTVNASVSHVSSQYRAVSDSILWIQKYLSFYAALGVCPYLPSLTDVSATETRCAIVCCAVLCYSMLCNVTCYTVLCCAMLCYAVL